MLRLHALDYFDFFIKLDVDVKIKERLDGDAGGWVAPMVAQRAAFLHTMALASDAEPCTYTPVLNTWCTASHRHRASVHC